MPLKKDLRLILYIQALLWCTCLVAECASRFLFGLRDPYQFFMLHGDATFYDFSLWLPRFRLLHTTAFFAPSPYPFLYPAPAALVYALFLPFQHPNLVYGMALAGTFITAALLFARALMIRGLRPSLALSATVAGGTLAFPFWYCYQRGNIEMWVWAITAAGAWALLRRRPWLAAMCFGIAGAIKLYPLVWLGLLLVRRQWKQLGLGIATAAAITLLSLWVIYPEIAVSARFIRAGLAQFSFVYTRNVLVGVTGFDHSLYTLIKRISLEGHLSRFPRLYTVLAGLTAVVIFFTRIRRQEPAQQVAAIAVAMILLPPVSFDYTLLHAYTALGALLFFAAPSHRRQWEMGLLAAVCSPLTEFIYRGSTFGGQLHAVLLLAVFLLAALPGQGEPGAARESYVPAIGRRGADSV